MTIVGHKFYGPRIGGLYVKGLEEGETPYRHWLMGGAQERGYRPGYVYVSVSLVILATPPLRHQHT